MPEITAVYPRMEQVQLETNRCIAKVELSESRFGELQDSIAALEQKLFGLQGKIHLMKEHDIADLRRRMESSENLTTDLAVQMHRSK